MKKYALLALFLFITNIFCGKNLYSLEESYLFNINKALIGFIPVTWELAFPENDKLLNGFSVGLFDLYIEASYIGLGFEFIPIQYNYNQNKHMLSLITITSYWNITDLLFSYYYPNFGPFISINYPNYYFKEDFTFNNFILKTGLKFTWFPHGKNGRMEDGLSTPLLDIEGGYRNISGTHGYYFSVKLGIVAIIATLFNNIK